MFRDHDLPICCLALPINPVHPDPARQQGLLAILRVSLRMARASGSPLVVSATGTYNPHSDWAPHQRNKTEAGFADCGRRSATSPTRPTTMARWS